MTALRQRMLEDLQIRHYSKTTIRLYLHAVSVFAQHFGKPPDQLDAEHIRLYQLFLIQEKKVSLSTFIQVVCALRFFYTHTLNQKIAIERIPFPRRERKLPLILSREEVKALLQAPRSLRHRTMLAVLYGSGLRVAEAAQLKVSDIDTRSQRALGAPRKRKQGSANPVVAQGCWNCSAATGAPSAPWNGCSPAPIPTVRFPPRPFTWPAGMRRKSPAFPSPFIRTPFGMPSPLIYSKPAPISDAFRSCLVMPTWKPPHAICRSPTLRSAPHPVRWIPWSWI